MIKILLLIDYSSEFSRRLLQGLVSYSKEYGPWIFYRIPSYYKQLYGKEGIIEWVKKWRPDAVIAEWDQEESDLLQDLNIPVMLQNYKKRSEHFSNLTGNYAGTGKLAARYFINKKYRNFAFYGNRDVIWSKERAEGYRQEIQKIDGNYFYYDSNGTEEDQWNADHIKLVEWLTALPKPVALFACDDSYALHISEICKMNNILIPDEISLLGVDNDELICNLSDPPISSIVLEVEKGGYAAGRLIHRLINKEKEEPFNIVIDPVRIEERGSTDKYNISNKYILKIIKHIDCNFKNEIIINDLINLAPYSRRNLEIKFKTETGTSIYQFILNRRVEHFAYLLLTTDRPLFDIASESGFSDSKNLSRIFKKFKGISPIEYRQKYNAGIS